MSVYADSLQLQSQFERVKYLLLHASAALKTKQFKKGDLVQWSVGTGVGVGEIEEVYTKEVEMDIEGSLVSRHATEDTPAALIKQSTGKKALMLFSELSKAGLD